MVRFQHDISFEDESRIEVKKSYICAHCMFYLEIIEARYKNTITDEEVID